MARRRIDAGRFSALASRPGVDTRVWFAQAIVKDIGFDAKEGTFVDIQMLPNGELETCYLGSPYAGGGFGDHCPVEVNDKVLVAVPMGDPGMGPVIICRFNNAGDPPHADFDSQNRVIRAKPGKNIRLVVSEGATVQIYAEKGATVRLGGDAAAGTIPGIDGVVNGQAIDPFTGQTQFALGNSSLGVFAKKEVAT
jgi:hypothetical protein